MKSQSSVSAVLFVIIALGFISSVCCQELSYSYYDESCDRFEEIVARKLRQRFHKDNTIAASLIRLHFHDCAVRGCDASILLDYEGSERNAQGSKTLRGYEVIEDIKQAVEKKCPRTVSCADILTSAARHATLLVRGPYWANKYGRKDGMVSYAEEANQLPNGSEDVTSQIEFYQSIGMNMLDMIVLSGAHSIGRSTCGSIKERLYNYKGSGQPDSTMDPAYLNFLRRKCKNDTTYVDLDPSTPFTFDNEYYINIEKNMGLLYSDQVLNRDHRTAQYVDTFASDDDNNFPYLFSSSMVKLGNIVGDAQDDGEIRLQCSRTNSAY